MDDLRIAPTGSSPRVELVAETGLLKLSGESYPENALDFYRPILAWLEAFMDRDQRAVQLDLELTYLNTSSIKSLMDLLDELEAGHRAGRSVTLNWYYDEENERALELADEFREDLTLPFHILPLRP